MNDCDLLLPDKKDWDWSLLRKEDPECIDLLLDEMPIEGVFTCMAYSAMKGGLSKEEACKKCGLPVELWDELYQKYI